MKKKFLIEFNYKSEEDIDFKYALEGAIDNMLYDCLEVGQLSDFDIIKIEEESKIKNSKPLTEDKKQILKDLMGSASSKQIDLNKVRNEWRENNERN